MLFFYSLIFHYIKHFKIDHDTLSYNNVDIYSEKIGKEAENEGFIYKKSINAYECLNGTLYFSLNDRTATVHCLEIFMFSIDYNDFPSYSFSAYNNSIEISKETKIEDSLYNHVELIIKSLILNQRKDIIFSKFEDVETVSSFIKIFPSNDVELWMNIASIENSEDDDYENEIMGCIWHLNYFPNKEHWDEVVSTTNWRKACINGHGLLHYFDDDEKITIFYIPKITVIFVLIVIVVLFFFILITTCIIGYFGYKRKLRVGNSLSET